MAATLSPGGGPPPGDRVRGGAARGAARHWRGSSPTSSRPGEACAIRPADPALENRVLRLLQEWLEANRISGQPHEVQVRFQGELTDVSFHCALEPGISIEEAHALSERLEIHLRNRLPNLGRVVIHAEPAGER